jgi:hypothetical protein
MGQSAFQELQPADEPFGDGGIAERIEDVPALAPLADQVMGAENRQILRNGRMADAQQLLKAIHIPLARMELDQNPQAVRVGDGPKQLSQFFGDQNSSRNSQTSGRISR